MSSSSVSSTERFTGRVKWFNNRAGYGFVTVTDGQNSGKDVFVHHSSIKVDSEQYKYLVQGEYVEFGLTDTKGSGDHEYQASSVSGINGGKLMCETRHELRSERVQHRSSNAEASEKSIRPVQKAVESNVTRNSGSGRGQGRGAGRGQGRGAGRGQGRGQGRGDGKSQA